MASRRSWCSTRQVDPCPPRDPRQHHRLRARPCPQGLRGAWGALPGDRRRRRRLGDRRLAGFALGVDKVIDVAYQGYAERICEKIKRRQAIEADYREKLRPINTKITAAKAKQEARVKEYLDKLEEKHKKERIEVYKEKFKAVAMTRERMNAELAMEYAKNNKLYPGPDI